MTKTTRRIPLAELAVTKVYPFLVAYQRTHSGNAPTLVEIGKKFKRTAEWARICLKVLVQENKIRVDRYKQRGVLIIKDKK